jgi:hypothetical protein
MARIFSKIHYRKPRSSSLLAAAANDRCQTRESPAQGQVAITLVIPQNTEQLAPPHLDESVAQSYTIGFA